MTYDQYMTEVLTAERKLTFSEKGCINKIQNALFELFGHEVSVEKLEICKTSPRFSTLMAIASHDTSEAWEILKRAVVKVADNPKTRAQLAN